ncbi:MAG TPA: hypothetical protein VGK48_09670 [Terriglobia bacterium]|jgi:hypothetical protein
MRSLILTLTLLSFSDSLFAQTVNTSTSLSGVIAAHGGAAAAAVGTIQILAHHTVRGATESVKISANVTDGEFRVDYGQPVTRSEVVPGVKSGVAPYELSNGNRRNKQGFVGLFAQLDMLSVLGIQPFTGVEAQVANVGSATLNGRPVTRLQVVSGRKQTYYSRVLPDQAEIQIDAATGLVVGISRVLSAEQNLDHTFQRTYVFSDFRTVNGLVFPFQIERHADGALQDTLIVDTVQLNPVFTTDLFRN